MNEKDKANTLHEYQSEVFLRDLPSNLSDSNPLRISKVVRLILCFFILIFIPVSLYYMEQILNYSQQPLSESTLSNQTHNYKQQLRELITKLQQRPSKFTEPSTYKFKPTSYAYFAYNLFAYPTPANLLAQLEYYQSKYQISKYQTELPMCIVSVGRNLAFQQRHYRFINSLVRLNYTNYRVILIDDASDDGTSHQIKQYLISKGKIDPRYQFLRQKITIITNKERKFALWNRDRAIRGYCLDDDIVVEIDPDDSFIGAQPLKYINSVYSHPDAWVFYSNYVYFSPSHGEPTQGISEKIPTNLLNRNIYRTSDKWVTSATRTFLKKLYQKIDQSDFIDKNFPEDGNLNQNKYYKWCADLFMHYSLIELAGEKHYRHSKQIFYYYFLDHNAYQSSHKKLDKYTSFLITPYQPLSNLQEKPKRVSNQDDGGYRGPQWLIKEWQNAKNMINLK